MANKLSLGIGERLKSLVPSGTTQLDFADSLGLKGSTFKTWVAETSEPKVEALAIIAGATGCDLNWLISGKGDRLSYGDNVMALVRRLDVQGSAGAGMSVYNELDTDPISFRRDWLKQNVGVQPEHLSVIQVQGDSMEPTIRDGSLVLVHHQVENIVNDGIYALNMDGFLYVKRVQKIPGGKLKIKSDNPAYDDIFIDKPNAESIRIIGLIKWVGNAF